MLPISESFEFDYFGSKIVYGRGCIEQLRSHANEKELKNGLVVCGSNVGANDAVMNPLKDGLGDSLVGIFDQTTPAKSAETVYDGIELMQELEPDFLVGVGGGSSLDIARQMSVFNADGRSLANLRKEAQDGDISPLRPSSPLTPIVVVPTTFAGADISGGGSVEILSAESSPTAHPIRISGSVMPQIIVYDPNLFATTPMDAVAGSAMNGFDKGLETIYARNATPISDATSIHGLQLLHDAFPKLPNDPDAFDQAVVGIILVQFKRQTSIVHAFGHGFARRYPVQQGRIHAVMVPHVLRYIFENVDGNRTLLAKGLDIDETLPETELADKVIKEVVAVRDSFGLPTRLREIDPVLKADLPAIAKFILHDEPMNRAPAGLNATREEIESVLRDAW